MYLFVGQISGRNLGYFLREACRLKRPLLLTGGTVFGTVVTVEYSHLMMLEKKNARDANVRRKKNVFDWMNALRTQFQGNHELKNYEDTNSGSPNSMKIFLWTQALGIILNSDSGIWALTSSVAIRPRDHMSTSRHLQRRHNDSSGMSWCCFRLCSAWKWFLEGRDLELS